MPPMTNLRDPRIGKRKCNQTSDRNPFSMPTNPYTGQEDRHGSSDGSVSEETEDDSQLLVTEEEDEESRDIFQRAFEKRFAPLAKQGKEGQTATYQKDSRPLTGVDLQSEELDRNATESEDQWDGFRTDEQSTTDEEDAFAGVDATSVEVVNYADEGHGMEEDAYARRYEKRSFMTSKPPSMANTNAKRSNDDSDSEDPQTAQTLLKNDLALSRLIRESNLLDQSTSIFTTNIAPKTRKTLQTRQRMTESRLAALGAKDSVLDQKNMPRVIKMGIGSKKTQREEKRRREAKENGVILEKPTTQKKAALARRERSVGNPGVGKFKGGRLELNKHDLKKLTSRPPTDGKRKRRR